MLKLLIPVLLLSVLVGPAYAGDFTTTDPGEMSKSATSPPMIQDITLAGERVFSPIRLTPNGASRLRPGHFFGPSQAVKWFKFRMHRLSH
jgi:hypothetical protein